MLYYAFILNILNRKDIVLKLKYIRFCVTKGIAMFSWGNQLDRCP